MSAAVTLLCLALGFPLAYFVANAPPSRANVLMVLILLPLWTSLVVRSAAWIVLLQDQGIVNDFLQWSGLTSEPVRLIFNRPGVLIAMTHVQLPFMILPIVATMKAIPKSYMRAAASLGAHPVVGVLESVPAADAAGRGGRQPARLHHVARLLRHAGAGRRRQRPDACLFHRLQHHVERRTGASPPRSACCCSAPRPSSISSIRGSPEAAGR